MKYFVLTVSVVVLSLVSFSYSGLSESVCKNIVASSYEPPPSPPNNPDPPPPPPPPDPFRKV